MNDRDSHQQPPSTHDRPDLPPPPAASGPERHGMSRRGWTIVLSTAIVAVFLIVGLLVPVPYVALGPGPTYDTLGKTDDGSVVTFRDEGDIETHDPAGQLRLTTVSVNEEITLLGALGLWASGRYALAPREQYFPPGESDEEVKKENVRQFKDSQTAAEVAALRHLKDAGVSWAQDITLKVLVQEITENSPSDGVLDAGDELVEVKDKRVSTAEQVRDALKGTKPGDKIDVVYKRDGKQESGSITLGEAPDDREIGFMGIQPGDHAQAEDLEIDIKLADVGGPSAGLMFSLAIIDRLTPDDLTGGKNVAGTGEVTATGQVGPIGGIGFKLVAAKEDGASVFLVPERNCPEAVGDAPDDLQLVKVGTVDDAVKALSDLDNAPSC